MADIPEVIDITALAGKFKSRAELQAYAELLFKSFKDSVQKCQQLESENSHLKQILAQMTPEIPTATKLVVSDEQAIAEIQLKKLAQTAQERELTIDETKRFDLLVKNLYLAKGKPTKAIPADKLAENITDAELISIAKLEDE